MKRFPNNQVQKLPELYVRITSMHDFSLVKHVKIYCVSIAWKKGDAKGAEGVVRREIPAHE